MFQLVLTYGLLSLFSFGGFLAFLFGFFRLDRTPAAHFLAVSGTVRLLPSSELSWYRATKTSLLAKNDAISTGLDSWASFEFLDGSRVDMDENTTVIVVQKDDEIYLDFVSGGGFVNIVSSPKFKVLEKGQNILERVKLRAPAAARPSFEQIVTPVSMNQAPAFDKNGDLLNFAQFLYAPVLLSPENGSTLTGTPLFKWKLADQKNQMTPHLYRLEIYSNSASDSKPVVFQSVKPEFKAPTLKPGKYFWTVKSVSKEGEPSENGALYSFEIKKVAAARAITSNPDPALDGNFKRKPVKFKK